MADIADKSDDAIEAARAAAIEKARRGPWDHLKPSGFCFWCGDPVAPGRLHCAPVENDCEAVHLKYVRFRKGEIG